MSAPQYPVNLNVAGRRCLVVGGGTVAARKAAGLVACGAEVTVVAPTVSSEIDELGVHVERRRYRSGEAAEYRLVITATDDRAVNQAVHDDAEAVGVWVNSADDPERCTFTLPAALRRGPVLVTTSTGGQSPALASWLRARLDALLEPELGALAVALAHRRAEFHAEGRSTEDVDWAPIIDAELARLTAPERDGVTL